MMDMFGVMTFSKEADVEKILYEMCIDHCVPTYYRVEGEMFEYYKKLVKNTRGIDINLIVVFSRYYKEFFA